MCADTTDDKGPTRELPEDSHESGRAEPATQKRTSPSPEMMKAMMKACGCGPSASESSDPAGCAAMMQEMMAQCGCGEPEAGPSEGERTQDKGTNRCC